MKTYSYIARCRDSEVRLLSTIYRDDKGTLLWKSNHLPAPHDVIHTAAMWPSDMVVDETPNLRGQRRRLGLTV